MIRRSRSPGSALILSPGGCGVIRRPTPLGPLPVVIPGTGWLVVAMIMVCVTNKTLRGPADRGGPQAHGVWLDLRVG